MICGFPRRILLPGFLQFVVLVLNYYSSASLHLVLALRIVPRNPTRTLEQTLPLWLSQERPRRLHPRATRTDFQSRLRSIDRVLSLAVYHHTSRLPIPASFIIRSSIVLISIGTNSALTTCLRSSRYIIIDDRSLRLSLWRVQSLDLDISPPGHQACKFNGIDSVLLEVEVEVEVDLYENWQAGCGSDFVVFAPSLFAKGVCGRRLG